MFSRRQTLFPGASKMYLASAGLSVNTSLVSNYGIIEKRRKAKINKHKRRKKLRLNRHKKRTWQK